MPDHGSPPSSVRLTDPRALRAYAHPTRMALVGLLRREGPLTATQAAGVVGESVASCSFHLRQLAKYGLVEEAGGGRGREKPWRATAMFTSWDAAPRDPAVAAATQGFQLAMAEQYFELSARWVGAMPEESAEWREAAYFGDYQLRVTAAELLDLNNSIQELVRPYLQRADGPDSAGPARDTRPVSLLHLAFPTDTAAPGAPTGPADRGGAASGVEERGGPAGTGSRGAEDRRGPAGTAGQDGSADTDP
ncbi:winged helix-turn-helix domain-containing protein [Streptomyces sp. 8L]|uniref:winged helix-turn-helix domain-containing protein n=1 Tax=Streptomyces sp. 8L TaxID=2877242 RepID=UPI001CD353F4|nr:helix-turn-helix domain-containing protein [Streptomyces sp. 8L]MCA1223036.1 helix-turn-helix domain-containing protein [Streptomyces sp. 8L]